MFTGLIAELGIVQELRRRGESYRLTLAAHKVMEDLNIGDSVAVNGVCLTAVALGGDCFTADVMPETVRHTNIGDLQCGDKVNLERTLRMCDRLDGHIVSGHTEGVGTITQVRSDGIANVFTIKTEERLLKYILPKGSIAVDGISLTVTQVTANDFSVSVIPHTARETTLGFKVQGAKVNLETDVIGKYVERLLSSSGHEKKEVELGKTMLLENGFM